MNPALTSRLLRNLKRFDTCAVSNAIDTFGVRLRNEGYTNSTIRCITPHLAPMVGYAVPLRIRCSTPRTAAHAYQDVGDWWDYVLTYPKPRVIVLEDMDDPPGVGAFLGEIHAHILSFLGCDGAITNGAVRDLSGVKKLRFHLFAGSVAVSHAYAHIVQIGVSVEIGGLMINPGDLIHADRHGILSIPLSIAPRIPLIAARMAAEEQRLISLCHSGKLSLEQLKAAVRK